MRFQSERDQRLAASGRLLLDAVCMQYLAHQYFNIDPRQVLWITQEALLSLLQSLKQNKASWVVAE
jgi:hypothetical protein